MIAESEGNVRGALGRAATVAAAMVLVTALAFGGGCGESPALPIPAAEQIPRYLGVWQVSGTATVTCPPSTRVTPLRSVVEISPGAISDLTVDFDCPVRFHLVVDSGSVVIDPGQVCTTPSGMLIYGTWTVLTDDGRAGTWLSTGVQSAPLPLGEESCSFNTEAVLTR